MTTQEQELRVALDASSVPSVNPLTKSPSQFHHQLNSTLSTAQTSHASDGSLRHDGKVDESIRGTDDQKDDSQGDDQKGDIRNDDEPHDNKSDNTKSQVMDQHLSLHNDNGPISPMISPKKIIEEQNYNKKVKYLANKDFTVDNSSFYPMAHHSAAESPSRSIPNTFQYKSHPNARTKSSIGASSSSLAEHSEANSKSAIEEHEPPHNDQHLQVESNREAHNSSTPPIKTSTIKEQEIDFNTTPDWMPPELAEKWVSNDDANAEHQPIMNAVLGTYPPDQQPDFSSSVRINRSARRTKDKDAGGFLDDLNLELEGSGNTMVHNTLSGRNSTPMWERARKNFEIQKNSQPKLQNIFMSMDSSEMRDHKDSKVTNNHSVSSTLSTPMASINNRHQLLNTSNDPFKDIPTGTEETTDAGKNVPNVPKKPESPLKLFGDDYNTFTKQILDGMLLKFNNKSNSHTPAQPDVVKEKLSDVISNSLQFSANDQKDNTDNKEPSNSFEQKLKATGNSHLGDASNYPKLKTNAKMYTDEYFKQNANNVFNNLQKKGYKNGKDVSQALTGQQSTSNTHTTATSTPKNFKVLENEAETAHQNEDDLEYSTFSSDMENTSESNFQQLNTNNNEYTSYDQSSRFFSHKPEDMLEEHLIDEHDGAPLKLSKSSTLRQKASYNSMDDSSYTYDDISDHETNPNKYSGRYQSTRNDTDNIDRYDSLPSFTAGSINERPSVLQNNTSIYDAKEGEIRDGLSEKVNELEKLLQQLNAGKLLKEIEDLASENKKLRAQINQQKQLAKEISEISIDQAEFSVDDYHKMQDFIKWKRASQLQLSQSPKPPISILKERNTSDPSALKGRVNPGIDLPVAYDNMVLDVKNQKWVSNNDKENSAHSLDSIEDLVSHLEGNGDDDSRTQRSRNTSRRGNSKLEVSFHLPHMDVDHSSPIRDDWDSLPGEFSSKRFHKPTKSKSRSPLNGDITHVSQLDDVTFSLTQQNLVSVITEVLAIGENFEDASWTEVNEINLSNHQLVSIKDLSKFLPALITIDLSRNELKFLDGLPKLILNLNVSENNLESITSFYQYKDLQHLNASGNKFANLTNFARNLHLTDVNLSFNKLSTLEGVNSMLNLTRLNVSRNEIKGEVLFRGSDLINLEELIMSENKITTVSGLESLPNLRILNLNENQLHKLLVKGQHKKLKKLLLKFNNLQSLNLANFPYLRVVRFDGNVLLQTLNFCKLKYLEELLCKSQYDHNVLEKALHQLKDVRKLDLSGNSRLKLGNLFLDKLERSLPFFNVNVLILCAMNLSTIPNRFADTFPNVSELNLNFNKLNDISELSRLKNIKKLYLVSNNINSTESIINGLLGTRSRMRDVDLRLNPCNLELYPYVFNPQELEFGVQRGNDKTEITPIQLETLDDIESFAIHYESLSKSIEDWRERDSKFISKLIKEDSNSKIEQRFNYETLLINFFKNLKRLDGGVVNSEKRILLKKKLHEQFSIENS